MLTPASPCKTHEKQQAFWDCLCFGGHVAAGDMVIASGDMVAAAGSMAFVCDSIVTCLLWLTNVVNVEAVVAIISIVANTVSLNCCFGNALLSTINSCTREGSNRISCCRK